MFLNGVILNDEDVNEIKANYPDAFTIIDEAPALEMDSFVSELKAVYSPYRIVKDEEGEEQVHDVYFDPMDPTRDLKPEFITTAKTRKDKDKIPVNTYQMLYLPPDGASTFPCGTDGSYFVIDYPVRGGMGDNNACVWLIDEDDKVITFDECRYTNSDINFVGRGLYSKVPVSKIIVCPLGDKAYLSDVSVYYSPYEKVKENLVKAGDNGIKDLTRKVNNFTFNTNYEKDKFITTQLAFTGGWKVKATLENGEVIYPKVYNAQGGFAGFVAPKGKVSYEITYMTPDFVKWGLVSVAAFIGLGAITATTVIIQRKKKETREDSLSSN